MPADPDSARELIRTIATDFAEYDLTDLQPTGDGPLAWSGYAATRARAQQRSGEAESVICGHGRLGDHRAVLLGFDFRHIGGSMGESTGRRIRAAFGHARAERLPVISLIATGGSRMQEGMRSLVQLQRVAAECELTRDAGLPHVAVLRHPTTGGVWATLGGGADVILAVPGATVAFAGHRVRRTVRSSSVDDLAYTAEGKLAYGQADQLVATPDLPATLTHLVDLLIARDDGPAEVPRALGRADLPPDGATAVQHARAEERPRARAYLDDYFDTRFPISGDRAGGVDDGMLCGFGRRDTRTIAYAAQTGTPNTPAGFRTATRLIRTADRLRLPVLTLVDTPGAAHDPAAERAGVGPALAGLFAAVAAATVPITTLVIGEGGSGGALALASPDRLWITPDGYFSVITPEAAAAILKRPPGEVAHTADQLRLRPQDLLDLGVVHGIATVA